MQNLSKQDINFLVAGIFGPACSIVSAVPMARKQGNGNFTGFTRVTYSDGEVLDFQFVMNARIENLAGIFEKSGHREMYAVGDCG